MAEEIVTRLKAERIRRGWTQTELAHRTGVSYSDISKIERRLALPYPSQAKRLAKKLGLAADALQELVHLAEADVA